MPYRPISNEVKEIALRLWGEGFLPSEILDLLGVSLASLYRWRDNKDIYGSVTAPDEHKRGRKRILDDETVDDLLIHIDDNADAYVRELQEWLEIAKDVSLSRTALQELIADCNYTFKKLRRKAGQQNAEAVAAFTEFQRRELTADMCVCVDESSKDNRTIYRHYGYAASGERAVITADFRRGTRYSILPAMSADGYIALRIVEGSVDTEEFNDFIINEVLPQMSPYPGERSVLIMDNCAIHKSEELQQAVTDAHVLLLYIPPYSPEFNPIEESFSAVKSWIRANFRDFIDSIDPIADLYEACASITADKARAFFVHAGYL